MAKSINIYPLDYQSIFEMIGDDSENFLQGQLSCDLKEVITQGSRLAAHCTPKGSMLSLMRVVYIEKNHFFIKTNTPIFEEAISHLNKYIMFSKADIKNSSNDWCGFGISGPDADDFLKSEFTSVPNETNDTLCNDNRVIIKTSHQRYELWLKTNEANEWLDRNNVHDLLKSSQLWKKQDIMDGIPDIYPQTSGLYIPQMCNLQALSGVSFKKGCYTGQEVITRLHFRGKLTKYLITATIENPSSNNSSLINKDVHLENKKVGQVLQSVDIEGTSYLQIIINQKYANGPLLLDNTRVDDIENQPYELDPNLFIRKD